MTTHTISSIAEGRAWTFGNDISTDFIAPSRYMHLRGNLPELAKHALEDADPTFATEVRPGDFIVAGRNFGMGSAREHAPLVLKLLGVTAIIAVSCARIFFRNSINVGVPVVICDTSGISSADRLRLDLAKSQLTNVTTGNIIKTGTLPPVMLSILREGGLKPFIRKHRTLDGLVEQRPPAEGSGGK